MFASFIRWMDSCASTNDEAMLWAEAGAPHGSLVVARTQHAGKGRRGRVWSSSEGDLFASFILRPTLSPSQAPPLTLAAGVAVLRTLQSFGVDARVKWPNDIYVGQRKLCGILTEMSTRADHLRHVVVGIGVNVSTTVFPDGLFATSLALESSSTPHALDVLGSIAHHFEDCLCEVESQRHLGSLVEALNQHLFVHPISFQSDGKKQEGICRSIDQKGQVTIESCDGNIYELSAGECEVTR